MSLKAARADEYLISGRTRRTSSVFPPGEPQQPTPALVAPHRWGSGWPANGKKIRERGQEHVSCWGDGVPL